MGRLKIAARRVGSWGALLSVAGALHANCASGAAGTGKSSKGTDSFFTNDVVLQIQIDIPNRGINTLRQYNWTRAITSGERIPVSATVREGAAVYTNVAVHLKGSAGSFRPVDDKPGFTLHFNKFAKGQRFHGLEKISLNNSVQDPSYISDKLCRELFEKAGVPVPRAGHASVTLNDRLLGLYVLTEGWNKQFLKRYFKNTKGNLYESGLAKDIDNPNIVASGESPDDHSDLRALIEACREPDLANRFARLEQVLDLDRFATFLALDAMAWNWDGYSMNRNNYRLFHDLGSGRFVFFPHGMDQMFGYAQGPIMPGGKALVSEALLQIPEFRRRYLARASELMTNVFRLETLTNRVDELALKLRPAQTATGGWGEALRTIFRGDPASELKQRIVQRRKSLEEQLNGIKSMLVFDEAGTARLTGWKSRTNSGQLTFEETAQKPASLHLIANEAGSAGAWWTTAWLEAGRYQVTGRARVRDVGAGGRLARAGAGFRVFSRRKISAGLVWDWFPFRESSDLEKRGEITISGPNSPDKRLSGNTDWVELSYDFELRQPAVDLEISCELRADHGEAWFDVDSLKIVRK